MRRLLLVSCLLLWASTPATALTLWPEGPSDDEPSLTRSDRVQLDAPVAEWPGWEGLADWGRRGKSHKPEWDRSHHGPNFGHHGYHHRGYTPLPSNPGGVVPEPGTALLVGLGLALLGASRRTTRRS